MRFLPVWRLVFVLTVTCGMLWSPPAARAVDSTDLVKKSARYDGRTVTFRGEVIGDIMRRGDGVWVNVNDDAYSRQGPLFHLAGSNQGQGVFLPKEEAAAITQAGTYRQRGDFIEVTGIFYAASEKYGGQMMIEGETVKIIKKGFPLESPISRRKVILTVFSAAAAAILTITLRVYSRRRR